MRIITLLTILASLLCTACGDDVCPPPSVPTLSDFVTYNQDINKINNYLADTLVADTLPSGLRYIVNVPGGDLKPNLCDEVNVTYSGYLLDGTPFDDGTLTFGLRQVIKGWQLGIPQFGRGGEGVLLIPSYLGYGVNGSGNSIPPNAPLIFDVTLNAF